MSLFSASPKDRFAVVLERHSRHPSPYRVVRHRRSPVVWACAYLDACATRGLSPLTVRTYAYSLLSICQWLAARSLKIEQLSEADLHDFIAYLRRQGQAPKSETAPHTINRKLSILRAAYAFRSGGKLPRSCGSARSPFTRRSHSFTGLPRRGPFPRSQVRVKVPQLLVEPLPPEAVVKFFEGLRTHRDLALTSLLLLSGLRSREVLSLRLEDLDFSRSQLRIHGKGGKQRIVPMAPETRILLENYLAQERPQSLHEEVFLVLKGPRRSCPMTPAGLRSLFRYHRWRSAVRRANPHRFRHTFAADMVKGGMSLPALQRLMGHAHIEMTLRYIHLNVSELQMEFLRAHARIKGERGGKKR